MENASKALLIGAEVLVGALIFSLMVYLFILMQGWSGNVQDNIDAKVIDEFNSKFTIYDQREDLTAQDVATIINLAKSNNEKYADTQVQTKVVKGVKNFPNMSVSTNLLKIDINDFLKNCSLNEATNEQYKYSCKIKSYNKELVSEITIDFVK